MTLGKTITTYFINGDPKGIKYVVMPNCTCKCLVIPHNVNEISEARNREELNTPSLYLLLDNEDKIAYIGESENFNERVKEHNKKAFWTDAVVFVATNQFLDKAGIKLLECLALEQAKKSNLFNLDKNENTPNEPSMEEHRRDSVIHFFEDIKTLASFLGYAIFEISHVSEDKYLYYKSKKLNVNAKGVYENSEFRVFAKSTVRKEPTGAHLNKAKRLKLLSENASDKGKFYELNKDILFKSPSAAANFCIGSNINGWDAWKNKQDKTLADIYNIKSADAE